jgi:hypothetical protein
LPTILSPYYSYIGQIAGPKDLHMLYRAFFLDDDDRIFAFHLMECLDDGDAIAQAQDLPAKCSAIEVWEGARVVGRTVRPQLTEVTADPYQISAIITGEVSDEPPRVLVSLAMLELQANRKERAAYLVDEIYAAFDQADMKIKTGTIERTDASNCRPAGRSGILSQSSLHHAADAGD